MMNKHSITKTLHTPNHVLKYVEVDLFHGRKLINKDVAKKNLLEVAEVFDGHLIKWGLIYGTLLGAVREGDFIEHDEDTDIFVLDENKEDFLCLVDKFIQKGFKIARYEGSLLSIIRNDEYIDFYFMKKNIFFNRSSGSYHVPNRFFNCFGNIEFLGRKFPTFCDHIGFLEYVYGKNWKTPIRNANAKGYDSIFKRVLNKIKRFFD